MRSSSQIAEIAKADRFSESEIYGKVNAGESPDFRERVFCFAVNFASFFSTDSLSDSTRYIFIGFDYVYGKRCKFEVKNYK